MPTARISKRTVDELTCPPGKDREILWDDAVAGFGVVAFRSGSKSYIIQFRQDGRSRRSRIGLHGRLTPDEARSEARKLLGQVEAGHDPVAQRKAARAVPTLREVAEDYLSQHVATKLKPRTAIEYRTILSKHILPVLGSKRITDVRRADVAKIHSKIAEQAPIAANRALAVVSGLWGWAARRDIVPAHENPARGVEKSREEGRERFLSTAEFARLGDALREAETVGLPYDVDRSKPSSKHAPKPDARRKLDPHAIAAVRLLIFTGARLREILHMRWQDVDFERGMALLPDSKTGRKPIILGAPALEVLGSLPRVAHNTYVIPGEKAGSPRADLKKPWKAISKAAGLEGLRIHDLRHTFASVGAGAAFGLPTIGRLLGHSQPQTTARYAHLDADPVKRAADAIGASIKAAMTRDRSHKPMRDLSNG